MTFKKVADRDIVSNRRLLDNYKRNHLDVKVIISFDGIKYYRKDKSNQDRCYREDFELIKVN